MWQHTATTTISAIGALVCMTATTASMVAALGMTPVWAYGRLRPFTALVRWNGLPVEYLGFVWFLTILLCTRLEARGIVSSRGRRALTFWTAGPAAGLGCYLLLSYSPLSIATAAATAAAVGLLSISAFSTSVASQQSSHMGAPSFSRRLAPVAMTLALAIVAAQGLRYAVSRIEPAAAMQLSFDRWFRHQPRLKVEAFTRSTGIRVVVFTDYQCPSCASNLPVSQALIDDAGRRSGLVIETVTRDFPLEVECNPGLVSDTHPAACEAAAAVRIVKDARGMSEAQAVERTFYSKGSSLSAPDVMAVIDRLSLAEVFRSQYAERLDDIRRDASAALEAGVAGTPTYFVNGVRLPSTQLLERALNHEIDRLTRNSRDPGGR